VKRRNESKTLSHLAVAALIVAVWWFFDSSNKNTNINIKVNRMSSEKRIVLVTGGAGFIGSHTVVELMAANFDVVIVDNLVNASHESLKRIAQLAGRPVLAFYEADVRDAAALERVFNAHAVYAVIHFAALKAVGESVAQPLRYYDNNVHGSIVLCQAMARANVKRLVFSSSATVYGDKNVAPFREDMPIGATNPYGETKVAVEMLLRSVAAADAAWEITLLRYFNPIGAHASGLIGEDPQGVPQNLLPFIEQVAIGQREKLTIFGDRYETRDGTCIRDYIHVVDLARGHIAALNHSRPGADAVNLGSSRGHSVLEVVRAFERVNGVAVKYEIGAARPGDIGVCYADASKAARVLNFTPTHSLDDMVASAWKWRSQNPNGYKTKV
jgi:UDP-glucose 4-epimerase